MQRIISSRLPIRNISQKGKNASAIVQWHAISCQAVCNVLHIELVGERPTDSLPIDSHSSGEGGSVNEGRQAYLGETDPLISIEIERTEDVLAQVLDILVRSKLLVEFTELFPVHLRRAWIALLEEACLPCQDVLLLQLRVFCNRFVDVIVDFGIVRAHVCAQRVIGWFP